MQKTDILQIVIQEIKFILGDLKGITITEEMSLKELGANSIDRADVIINSMEKLELNIPLLEFGQTKNISGIVEILYNKARE